MHFPTLIFFELVFNRSTLMQAAARAYRLNQTHALCRVYYLYYEGTMEATAVQLMSRKQRAAKLLTGDTGLTGLDALTEGEGGFEAALLDAIGRDGELLDPTTLFRRSEVVDAIGAEDAAYWNVEAETVVPAAADEPFTADPLLATALDLGAVIVPPQPRTKRAARQAVTVPASRRDAIGAYLDTVQLIADAAKWLTLREALFTLLETDTTRVGDWLREHRVVFPGCEPEVAERLIALMQVDNQPAPLPHPLPETPAKPARKPRGEVIPFPRPEPTPGADDVPIRQLALF